MYKSSQYVILSFRRLQRAGEESQRKFHALQERLDSTVQRYEEEISYLRSQKARLEEQLDMERNSNYSMLGIMACMFNKKNLNFTFSTFRCRPDIVTLCIILELVNHKIIKLAQIKVGLNFKVFW